MSNSKKKMFDLHFDDSDEQIQQQQTFPSAINHKSLIASDKYVGVFQKSMFGSNEHFENDDYQVIEVNSNIKTTAKPLQKKEKEISSTVSIQQKELIQEFVVQNIAKQIRDTSFEQIKRQYRQENHYKVEEDSKFFINPFSTKKLLEIDFSESQSSSDQIKQKAETKQIKHLRLHELKSIKACEMYGSLNQKNIIAFCKTQIPPGSILGTQIYRRASGLNYFWPEYQLLHSENCQILLYAKKMGGSTTANYYISSQKGVQSLQSQYFICKLRANFSQSQYQVYSKGVSPKMFVKNSKNCSTLRQIIATIKFKPQSETLQPRQFDVYLLRESYKYYDLEGIKSSYENTAENGEIGLNILYNIGENKTKIYHFRNRKPIYSQAMNGFILNFNGRVQKSSIKNFILEQIDSKREVMMLGKYGDDQFRLDISHPMKPYFALCICLANFDSKFVSG